MDILTVSGLNMYVRSLLDADKNLQTVFLKGEISNLTDHYRSGHIYLTLKDEKAAIKAVMFSGNAGRLRFRPKDGMKVLVRGRVSVYDVTGTYQLYIDDMQPDGIGALNLAFEQLKKKLLAEGLFDEAHKKTPPHFPDRIGVITSPTGAAVQDILRILQRRYPAAEIIMCPVTVQGENAAKELTEAVERFDKAQCADVIIIGRGGGSIEDLWAFNDEALARAIYKCRIPVVSAVGHETDFTICDFVADLRASTPSAGAELVSPEIGELTAAFLYYRKTVIEEMNGRLQKERERLLHLKNSRALRSPQEIIHFRRMKLDLLCGSLKASFSSRLAQKKNSLVEAAAKLDSLSPLKVLARGYAIARKDSSVVRSVNDVVKDDKIEIILHDGRLDCTVCGRKEEHNEKET